MENILGKLDDSLRVFLVRDGRTEKDFHCADCGKPLVDVEHLSKVRYSTHLKNGNPRSKPVMLYDNGVDKPTIYLESDVDRWMIQGKVLAGKTYYRKICWDCFFKKLRQTTDIARRAKKSRWYKKVLDGENPIPERCTSPSPYFKLLFDVSDEVLDKERLKFATASYESFVARFGEEEGKKKYDAYRARQAYTCSKEYMAETRGWTEKQWNEFNASRASTKENFIKRYGKEAGKKRWDKYCAHEAYVGCALQYFIDKYGKEEGTKKYSELCNKKDFKLKCYSNVSQKLFKQIDEKLGDFAKASRWQTKNFEFETYVKLNGIKRVIRLDYYLNCKVIEFNGDFWHANPAIYSEDDILRHKNNNVKAKDIWNEDKSRLDAIEELGFKVLVVWERDYIKDPSKVVEDCTKFLKNES